MKNVKIFFLTFLSLTAGLFTSCGPEENFEPGPVPSGLQIYFPNDAPTTYALGDKDASVSIPVKRINSAGAVEVPLLYDMSSMEDADQALFTDIPESVKFDDGKTDAEIVVSFNRKKLVDGKEYKISFLLSDDENTSPYGYRTIDVVLTPWPWELLGKGKFRDDYFCYLWENVNPAEVEVEIYRHKSSKGIYMLRDAFGWPLMTAAFGRPQDGEAGLSKQFTFTPTNFVINCSAPDKVSIEEQFTGVTETKAGAGKHYIKSVAPGKLVDGVITFPEKGIALKCDVGELPVNEKGLFRVIFPGYEATDYSFAVSYSGMKVESDNETCSAVFDFAYGADVTGVSYVLVSGDVSEKVSEIVAKIADGTAENIKELENFVPGGSSMSLKMELEKGLYTLVAVPKDKHGEFYASSASFAYFYFPGMGGSVPDCDISAKLYKVADYPDASDLLDKCPPQSSILYEIAGSEIKSMKYFFNTTEYIKYAEKEGILKDVVQEKGMTLNAEAFDEFTKKGKTWNVFIELEEQTSWSIAVLAENNYGKKKLIVSSPLSTDPLPYNGELSVGEYKMTCSVVDDEGKKFDFENIFSLRPTLVENKFKLVNFVSDLLKLQWYATYDSAKSTLTLDGSVVGHDDWGPVFGQFIGVSNTQAAALWTYASDATAKQGSDPVVFSVDKATKELNKLNTTIELRLGQVSGQQVGNIGIVIMYTKEDTKVAKEKASASSVSSKSLSRYSFMPLGSDSNNLAVVSRRLDGGQSYSQMNRAYNPASVEYLNIDAVNCEPLVKEGPAKLRESSFAM